MGRSPYEIVTGLRPQGISQHLFEKLGGKTVDPNSYVEYVSQYLQKVHDQIAEQFKVELKGKRYRAEGQIPSVPPLEVGDHVLLRKPPAQIKIEHGFGKDEPVSSKLMPLVSAQVFEVYKVTGARHVVLCDPDTRETDLGFAQPVSIDRLVRYELCNLEVPIDADYPVVIELITEPGGAWRRGTITA